MGLPDTVLVNAGLQNVVLLRPVIASPSKQAGWGAMQQLGVAAGVLATCSTGPTIQYRIRVSLPGKAGMGLVSIVTPGAKPSKLPANMAASQS